MGSAIAQWRHLPGKIVLDLTWHHLWKTKRQNGVHSLQTVRLAMSMSFWLK